MLSMQNVYVNVMLILAESSTAVLRSSESDDSSSGIGMTMVGLCSFRMT